MANELKRVELPANGELALLLKYASTFGRPVVIDTGEAVYSVSVGAVTTPPTPEEVARSKEGILKAAGRWKEIVDAEAFKGYIRERRRTSSRPPVRL